MAFTEPGSARVPKPLRRNLLTAVCVAVVIASCGGADQATPVEIATAFVEAYEALDVDAATSYLAADADVSLFNANTEGLAQAFRWDDAMGFQVLLDSCAETSSGALGTTVRCDYDYHAIRSEDIGLGPYGGNWLDFIVRDGEVVSVSDHLETTPNGFSSEMWDPFATWVAENHPDDVTVMYTDSSQGSPQLTEESTALWEQRTREYVDVLGG